MFDNIKGLMTFEVVAPDINALLNKLKKSCITAQDVYCKGGKVTGLIYKNDFNELKQLCSECDAQLSITDKYGAVFKIFKYRKRIGIIAGFILSLFLVAYLSNIVMVIEIYGNATLPDKKIMSYLNDSGIHIGTYIPVSLKYSSLALATSIVAVA